MSEQEKSVKDNSDKVADNYLRASEKMTNEQPKVSDRVTDKQTKVPDKQKVIVENVVAKALETGDKLTSNRITILQLMAEYPSITKIELVAAVGVTNMYLSGKFSNQQIMSLTGHTKEKTFKKYLRLSEDEYADDVARVGKGGLF